MQERTKSATKRFVKVFGVLNGIIAICQGLTIIFGFIAAYVPSKRAWAFIGVATPLVLAVWKWCSWHKEELESGKHQAEATLFERFITRLGRVFTSKKDVPIGMGPAVTETEAPNGETTDKETK